MPKDKALTPREETRTSVLDEPPLTIEALAALLQDRTQPLERQLLAASAILDLASGFLRPPS